MDLVIYDYDNKEEPISDDEKIFVIVEIGIRTERSTTAVVCVFV